MKKMLVVLSSVVAASISLSVFAAMPAGQTAPTGPGAGMMGGQGGGANHPCKAVEEACKAAGFVKGEAASGKGLFKDCMKPIMEGKPVAGVNVNPAEVQACHAKMEQRHAQGGQGGQGMMQQQQH